MPLRNNPQGGLDLQEFERLRMQYPPEPQYAGMWIAMRVIRQQLQVVATGKDVSEVEKELPKQSLDLQDVALEHVPSESIIIGGAEFL